MMKGDVIIEIAGQSITNIYDYTYALELLKIGQPAKVVYMAATWKGQQRVVGRRVPVVIPAVHEELCTEHVLVIEWLDGVNLRAAGPLIQDKGLDRAALARALLRSMPAASG